MQHAVEDRVAKMFGVTLDFSKSGSGSAAPNRSTQPDDARADEIADRVALLLGE